jgi:hypothetical protein
MVSTFPLTYSDQARSGIDLAGRPGVRQLLDDVTSSRADFRAVLVYDISRWGRFQDTDESACYEFLCRRAGVNVVYCAEPFANDISLAATLLKTLKRTMAGEYLRELSVKVFAGQCRIVRKGYKAGGPAGYGLRRLLLTSDGKPKIACLCPQAPHPHMERRYLVVPGIGSSRIHVLDTKADPNHPKIVKVIEPEEFIKKTGYTSPHTIHCGPDGVYGSALGSASGDGPGGIFLMDAETFEL